MHIVLGLLVSLESVEEEESILVRGPRFALLGGSLLLLLDVLGQDIDDDLVVFLLLET